MATVKKVLVQTNDAEYNTEEITEKAIADFKANNKGAINDIKVYIKPEERKAYYTVNDGKVSGSVDI